MGHGGLLSTWAPVQGSPNSCPFGGRMWTSPPATVRIYASKTKTYRTVPINPEFLKRMEVERDQSVSGFVIEYMGRGLTTIRKSFKNACQRAGSPIRPGCTICGTCSLLPCLSKGADLAAAVSKMMGHATVKMTADTYYHYMEGEKERAVRLLPGLVA